MLLFVIEFAKRRDFMHNRKAASTFAHCQSFCHLASWFPAARLLIPLQSSFRCLIAGNLLRVNKDMSGVRFYVNILLIHLSAKRYVHLFDVEIYDLTKKSHNDLLFWVENIIKMVCFISNFNNCDMKSRKWQLVRIATKRWVWWQLTRRCLKRKWRGIRFNFGKEANRFGMGKPNSSGSLKD